MIIRVKDFYIILSPYIFLTVFLFLLKCKLLNLFLCFIALTLHELGHIVTAYIIGEKIALLKILPVGFSCKFKNQNKIGLNKMLKILIAGPAVNFITAVLFFYWTPQFAMMSFFIGIINLLPIYELDGMRIINILLKN